MMKSNRTLYPLNSRNPQFNLLDNPGSVRGKRVIDVAAGSGVSSMAAARCGAVSVTANDIDLLSLVAARLNAEANGLAFEVRPPPLHA